MLIDVLCLKGGDEDGIIKGAQGTRRARAAHAPRTRRHSLVHEAPHRAVIPRPRCVHTSWRSQTLRALHRLSRAPEYGKLSLAPSPRSKMAAMSYAAAASASVRKVP